MTVSERLGYIPVHHADGSLAFEIAPWGGVVRHGAQIDPTQTYFTDDAVGDTGDEINCEWFAIKPAYTLKGLFGEEIAYFNVDGTIVRRIRPAEHSQTRVLGEEWWDVAQSSPLEVQPSPL